MCRRDRSREVSERARALVIPSEVERPRGITNSFAARFLDFARNDGLRGTSVFVKICDLTQFYSPRSGGVKRYLHEKIAYLEKHSLGDEHVLIVPGARSELIAQGPSRVYSIASPLVSRRTGYRALLDLRAIDEIIEREQPDIMESADPYQLGWKAVSISRARRIPAVAFYHSDFAASYLRAPAQRLGGHVTTAVMDAAARYGTNLYNRFAVTLAPSEEMAQRLGQAGIRDVRVVELGVDINLFKPASADVSTVRLIHNIPAGAKLLLYVGRLAAEKNTATLCEAFEVLVRRRPGDFHLLVVGDGQLRGQVEKLRAKTSAVTWLPYCEDGPRLAELYRSANLFVHPGMQETFGLVALESQACGTPVVGIRGSAMDRIILHDQVTWAATDCPEALAQAIEDSVARDLSWIGARAAEAVAARYSWREVFARLLCIYREVCADYQPDAAR